MKALRYYFTRQHQSLFQQLLIGFAASLFIIGSTTLWINYGLVEAKLEQQVGQRAQTITQGLEFATEGLLENNSAATLRRVVQNYATLPAVTEVTVIDPTGRILTRRIQDKLDHPYATLYPELKDVLEEASITGIQKEQQIRLEGKLTLVNILPFRSRLFGASDRRGVVIAMLDLQEMRKEAWNTFMTSTLTLTAGILAILLIMGILIQQTVLQPLKRLNVAIAQSKTTGMFVPPPAIPNYEIGYLTANFGSVFKQLEAYEQLQTEIAQRKQVEATLRQSEASERAKSQQLEQTINELQQAQFKLIQAEKMSSLGQLVAGVAHEINNPVNFIHGNIHYAKQYIEDLLELLKLFQAEYPNPSPQLQIKAEEIDLEFLQDDLPKMLSSMQVGADRIREIVKSLRIFSRLDEAEVKDVDIHEGINSTLMILQSRLKGKPDHPEIRVVQDYDDLPKIECYAGQLNQVFMNILSNAIDAVDEATLKRTPEDIQAHPGTITIRTKQIGEKIAVCIADNGSGMSEDVLQRLYNPFFTTKPVGKGTGMGMSISHQIVTKQHNGSLHCTSILGQGTEFVIELPIQQNQAHD